MSFGKKKSIIIKKLSITNLKKKNNLLLSQWWWDYQKCSVRVSETLLFYFIFWKKSHITILGSGPGQWMTQC